MEDRFRHHLFRLGIPVLGLTLVAVLVFRASFSAAFRMVGLWTYLATVNRAWPDMNLVQEARRAPVGHEDVDVGTGLQGILYKLRIGPGLVNGGEVGPEAYHPEGRSGAAAKHDDGNKNQPKHGDAEAN